MRSGAFKNKNMEQKQRILLDELNQYIDYLSTIKRIYNVNKASNLPRKYLGISITKGKIMQVEDKIKLLAEKMDMLRTKEGIDSLFRIRK
jgi:hypothetical protein